MQEKWVFLHYGVTGTFDLIRNDDEIELDGINNNVTLISRGQTI
ncbi:hypothetical protein [Ruminiclostridium cellulolyticum]|nr:hypothetical protein [Ruminiclostridium cellulolyticum]